MMARATLLLFALLLAVSCAQADPLDDNKRMPMRERLNRRMLRGQATPIRLAAPVRLAAPLEQEQPQREERVLAAQYDGGSSGLWAMNAGVASQLNTARAINAAAEGRLPTSAATRYGSFEARQAGWDDSRLLWR